MPGVGEDEVEVFVKDNTTVVFKGQALKEAEENSNQYDSPRTYMGSFNLFFDPDQSRKIRTEVKCGVLRFFVPAMVKENEDASCLIPTNNPSPPSLIFTVPLPESSGFFLTLVFLFIPDLFSSCLQSFDSFFLLLYVKHRGREQEPVSVRRTEWVVREVRN